MQLQTSLQEVMETRWRELSAREASSQVLVVRTVDSDKGARHRLPKDTFDIDFRDLPLVLRTGITQGEESWLMTSITFLCSRSYVWRP